MLRSPCLIHINPPPQGDETWHRPPKHHAKTAPSPSISTHDEVTYSQLLGDTKAFVEFVLAFILAIGFQLKHQSTCDGYGSLTRHSHYGAPGVIAGKFTVCPPETPGQPSAFRWMQARTGDEVSCLDALDIIPRCPVSNPQLLPNLMN